MGSLMKQTKDTATRKGTVAALTTLGGIALTATVTPILGVPVLAFGAYLGYDWFMYRAKRGMRF